LSIFPGGLSLLSRRMGAHYKMLLVVILCLAMALAVTSVVQSVALLLLSAPLPFQHEERLSELRVTMTRGSSAFSGNNAATLRDWRSRLQSQATLTVTRQSSASLRLGGIDRRVRVSFIDENYFDVFSTFPTVGESLRRAFANEENVAIVRRAFYDSARRSTPNLEYLSIGDTEYRIALIAEGESPSPSALAGRPEDVWLPLKSSQLDLSNRSAYSSSLRAYALLAANGASFSDLQRQLEASSLSTLRAETVNAFPPETQLSISVSPLRETIIGESASTAMVLLLATSLIYLLVCSIAAQYIASIFSSRWRAHFIQHVLGATRRHLVTLILQELLAGIALASVLAIALSYFGLSMLRQLFSDVVPRLAEARMSVGFLGSVLALAGLALLMISIAVIARVNLSTLTVLGSGAKGSKSQSSVGGQLLAGSQFALVTLCLLIASFSLVGLLRKLTFEVGFKTKDLLLVQVELPEWLRSIEAKRLLAQRLQASLQFQRGPHSAALVDLPPLSPSFTLSKVQPLLEPHAVMASVTRVNESYLPLLEIQPLSGRMFTHEEILQQHSVAIISDSLRRELLPRGNPLGASLVIAGKAHQVIGVVNDIRNPFRNDNASQLQIYMPMEYIPESNDLTVLVSYSAGDTLGIQEITRRIHAIDRELFVGRVEPINQSHFRLLNQGLFQSLIAAMVFTVALGMAALIVYSTTLSQYAANRHSILIKAAVGASSRTLLYSLARTTSLGILIAMITSVLLMYALQRYSKPIWGEFFSQNMSISLLTWLVAVAALVAFDWLHIRRLLNADLRDLSRALQ